MTVAFPGYLHLYFRRTWYSYTLYVLLREIGISEKFAIIFQREAEFADKNLVS